MDNPNETKGHDEEALSENQQQQNVGGETERSEGAEGTTATSQVETEEDGKVDDEAVKEEKSQPKLVFDFVDTTSAGGSHNMQVLDKESMSTQTEGKGNLVIEIEDGAKVTPVPMPKKGPPTKQISVSSKKEICSLDLSSIGSSTASDLDVVKINYNVTVQELEELCERGTRLALADVVERGIERTMTSNWEEETTSTQRKVFSDMASLIENLRGANTLTAGEFQERTKLDADAEKVANSLTEVILLSSPQDGIDPNEVSHRREVFGRNTLTNGESVFFLKYCWEAMQNFLLIMLIVLGIISIVIGVTTVEDGEVCGTCWMEGAAILCSVFIIVVVTASISYAKKLAFSNLCLKLQNSNRKAVIRGGNHCLVTDDEIVVGDIVCINSHNFAAIPADCILLGPDDSLKVDESFITGDMNPIRKRPGDVIRSGTFAAEGSGRMVVIAVGKKSVAGKIKAGVFKSKYLEPELGFGDESSPLFLTTDLFAQRVCLFGIAASILTLYGLIAIGVEEGIGVKKIITYLLDAIAVFAVAMPEGLPLAVTLALAFSSSHMMKEHSLVRSLDACENMGCTTTICTNKTGTLTSTKMTARACCSAMVNHFDVDPSIKLSQSMTRPKEGISQRIADFLCRTIAINTMDETVLYFDEEGEVKSFSGNPMEAALLEIVHDLGVDYEAIRKATKGRSVTGALSEFSSSGKHFIFSPTRKMMSWAVPLDNGGYRIYCKGAQDVVLDRSISYVRDDGTSAELQGQSRTFFTNAVTSYSRRGMTCVGLAYRDLPSDFNLEAFSDTDNNLDGTPAFEAETNLTLIAIVGMENPLRPEVPMAIQQCHAAGIDVRLVTGDNSQTAFAMACKAGILQDPQFGQGGISITNLKQNVLMEGKDFRRQVYRIDVDGKMDFDQSAFDRIWPRLRVLAQSSPDDKLALAHGLNHSNLFADYETCNDLKGDGIDILPNRQVVTMTGRGSNDAGALRRADVGFAMGISGTQIAKDAADIILMDDNFASIVTAVKCGRNVYASIQKFLQFQLCANLSTVVIVLVGIFAYHGTPLAAIHLLWLNLIMDSLAGLALASEPPLDDLLYKLPVDKSNFLANPRVWTNIVGQATYQISVILYLLFQGPELLGIEEGYLVEARGESSVHYTIIFNTFVWMQLFNELNCRSVSGHTNVFLGLLENPVFCLIFAITGALQSFIVDFGSEAFHVADGGLETKFWALSFLLGLGSIPIQQLINVIFTFMQRKMDEITEAQFTRSAIETKENTKEKPLEVFL